MSWLAQFSFQHSSIFQLKHEVSRINKNIEGINMISNLLLLVEGKWYILILESIWLDKLDAPLSENY